VNEFDKLKSLLFGEEKESLDSIKERVELPEARTHDVADILPEAIYQSHKNGDHLSVSLRAPVSECLEQAIHEDPQKYGDALYPVMGPAIRRSITEALRAIAQQINEAVEQSLTPQGLQWRFRAWRAGIPFGDYVLQKTLLYRVEQAYLISRESGLLMAHVHHDAEKIKDSDAVSAMFTAIQDFVKESFSPDRSGRLESADMGEFTLWAVHGPHALLVCVIRGVPPQSLRVELSAILERIHFRYGEPVRTFAGDAASIRGVDEELEDCLKLEARQSASDKTRGISTPMSIVLLLLAAAIAYWTFLGWQQHQRVSQFSAALGATPGIYLDDVAADGRQLRVTGMRDPLAMTPQAIAESIGLSAQDVSADMQPFQSLAPDIIARRAAQQFGRPDGVGFEIEGSTLLIVGPAPIEWQQTVATRLPFLLGIEAVEYQATAAERNQIVREWLSPPAGIDVSGDANGVNLSGSAPAAWIERARGAIDGANLPWPINLPDLPAGERTQLEDDVAAMSGRNFFFTNGTELAAERENALPAYVAQLTAVVDRATEQGLEVRVVLTGFTDSVGDLALNEQLAARRTATVAAVLAASGYDPGSIVQRHKTADDEDASVVDFDLRRVSADLTLEALTNE
jgi:OOP family OmpA-OmpF porin